MRILIVLSSSAFFRHFDSVVTDLCVRGHEVTVLTRMTRKGDDDDGYQDEMVASVASFANGAYDFSLRKRHDRLKPVLRAVRGTVNHALYLRTQHSSPQLGGRLAGASDPRVRRLLTTSAGRRMVSSDRLWRAYRRLQAIVPADPVLCRQVAAHRPDVVVGCPFLYTMSADVEYVRAAQRLGVPAVAAVASWDNLSTKGAFHLLPDRVLVWNDSLAAEAEAIHAVPRTRIVSTGAPKFDAFFELGPSLGREEFSAGLGLQPGQRYVLFLGSSAQVAGDETGFVRELTDELAKSPATAGIALVVRPHPLNADRWQDFHHPGVAVFPRQGQRPDMPRHRADYLNTLAHAVGVIGVNTTALLEAAILDRPCLSVVSARHREGQVDRGHFHHLLEGGFMEVVPDLPAAAMALGRVLDGHDDRRQSRRRFVERFIRPAGRDRPAGGVMADAILEAGVDVGRRPLDMHKSDALGSVPMEELAVTRPTAPLGHP